MIDLPTTARSIAAVVAGAVGLVWWWVRGAPKRKLSRRTKQLAELSKKAAEAKDRKDEKAYNDIMAERRRLLDSWMR